MAIVSVVAVAVTVVDAAAQKTIAAVTTNPATRTSARRNTQHLSPIRCHAVVLVVVAVCSLLVVMQITFHVLCVPSGVSYGY